MRTTIIGTAKGIFVVDAATGTSSVALEGPSVRHLSRVNGHCVAGSTAVRNTLLSKPSSGIARFGEITTGPSRNATVRGSWRLSVAVNGPD